MNGSRGKVAVFKRALVSGRPDRAKTFEFFSEDVSYLLSHSHIVVSESFACLVMS